MLKLAGFPFVMLHSKLNHQLHFLEVQKEGTGFTMVLLPQEN